MDPRTVKAAVTGRHIVTVDEHGKRRQFYRLGNFVAPRWKWIAMALLVASVGSVAVYAKTRSGTGRQLSCILFWCPTK
jgi:hypothetical protein